MTNSPVIILSVKQMPSEHPQNIVNLTPYTKSCYGATWTEYRYPEIAPPQYYNINPQEGIVAKIFGNKWFIQYFPEYDRDDIPIGGIVKFTKTNGKLTKPDFKLPKNRSLDTEFRISSYRIKLFGTPAFIQSPEFPAMNSLAPFNLITHESGWGDAGNENILAWFDANGIPINACLEASCH